MTGCCLVVETPPFDCAQSDTCRNHRGFDLRELYLAVHEDVHRAQNTAATGGQIKSVYYVLTQTVHYLLTPYIFEPAANGRFENKPALIMQASESPPNLLSEYENTRNEPIIAPSADPSARHCAAGKGIKVHEDVCCALSQYPADVDICRPRD